MLLWLLAGGNPGPYSSVDRIDYSNDTATATAKGPLSVARHGLVAASAAANALPTSILGVLIPAPEVQDSTL